MNDALDYFRPFDVRGINTYYTFQPHTLSTRPSSALEIELAKINFFWNKRTEPGNRSRIGQKQGDREHFGLLRLLKREYKVGHLPIQQSHRHKQPNPGKKWETGQDDLQRS